MAINITGISAYFHDSACCLLKDGALSAAVQEERFSRKKHDQSLPKASFRYCLEESGLTLPDVDCIAYYEEPCKKLGRQIWMGLPGLPKEKAALLRLDAGRPKREIRELLGYEGHIEFVSHHESHAASTFYFSGFPEAALMTVDGVGEWATTTYGHAQGKEIVVFEEVHFPDSIGLLFSTITNYLGFSVNDGEYKVMGLAPYGKPLFADQIRTLIRSESGGQYSLDLRYFDFSRQDRMYSEELVALLGRLGRNPGTGILPFHQDVACSLQVVLEELLLEKASYLHGRVGSENLCMAGGVALNCVANSRILRSGPFKRLFVPPAPNDAGGALGAAAVAHVRLTGARIDLRRLEHAYFGPGFSNADVCNLLVAMGVMAADFRGNETDLLKATVDRLVNRQIIGWFQRRMEFGPRALGARSILADPRDPSMRERINFVVKKREPFRPFGPAVLEEKAADHFDLDHPVPFMTETCQVKSQLDLPAITHVDGSARVQTVNAKQNPRFARLLQEFERRTGCPVLLNTSFNMRDEPIVCSLVDAFICFVRSNLDALVAEDFIIDRSSFCSASPGIFDRLEDQRQAVTGHSVYTLL